MPQGHQALQQKRADTSSYRIKPTKLRKDAGDVCSDLMTFQTLLAAQQWQTAAFIVSHNAETLTPDLGV